MADKRGISTRVWCDSEVCLNCEVEEPVNLLFKKFEWVLSVDWHLEPVPEIAMATSVFAFAMPRERCAGLSSGFPVRYQAGGDEGMPRWIKSRHCRSLRGAFFCIGASRHYFRNPSFLASARSP